MANYNFSEKPMEGGFTLITISREGSNAILLYGTYYGCIEGHLYIPTGAVLTTEIISDIHSELKERYDTQTWYVVYDRTSPDYEEQQRMFKPVGLPEKAHL